MTIAQHVLDAQGAVRRAVADGRLIRPDACERCGAEPGHALNGHHEDYSLPLDVTWLCVPCHSQVHPATRPADRGPARKRPTLDQVRKWPATTSVADGALAFGVSRAAMYQYIADGICPVETIKVGGRIRILTHSLISVLEGRVAEAGQL